MEILNDLTKCNFYHYILGGGNTSFSKGYLIFKFLQLSKNNTCIGDAFLRRKKFLFNNQIISYRNQDLKEQYQIIKNNRISDFTFGYCCEKGYLLALQYLYNKGIDIYSDNHLLQAILDNQLLIIKYLVNNGINIHGNNNDEQPLLDAIRLNNSPIIKYLINNGANVSYKRNKPFIRAVATGNLDVIKYMVDTSDPNNRFNLHFAMVIAVQNNRLNVLKYLESIGADIHARDDIALRWAAKHGALNSVRYLIERQANVHANNDQALQWAVKGNRQDVVRYLISNGANPNVLTPEQRLQFNI